MGIPFSRAAADWPTYEIVKTKVDFDRSLLDAAYAALQKEMDGAEVDTNAIRTNTQSRSQQGQASS